MKDTLYTAYKDFFSSSTSIPYIISHLLSASLAHVIAWNPYWFLPERYKKSAQNNSIGTNLERLSQSSSAWYHVNQCYNIVYNSVIFAAIDRYLKRPVRNPIVERFNISQLTASIGAASLSYAVIPSLLLYHDGFAKEARTMILRTMNSSIVASKNYYFFTSNISGLITTKSTLCFTEILIQRFFENNKSDPTLEIATKHLLMCTCSLCLIYFGLNEDNIKCHIIKSFTANIIDQYNLHKVVANLISTYHSEGCKIA